jgi:hypothetical protein
MQIKIVPLPEAYLGMQPGTGQNGTWQMTQQSQKHKKSQ